MVISYNFSSDYIYKVVHELIRVAFPSSTLVKGNRLENADTYIEMKSELNEDKLVVSGLILTSSTDNITKLKKEYFINTNNAQNQINKYYRKFIFALLSKHQQKPISSYGTLTGVRPVKIVHRLIDENYTNSEIKSILENDYYLYPEKADLLIEVANNNRPYLLSPDDAKKLVSIYIGIPYCPSRCYYCSFPGAVLKNYENEVTPYLQVLFEEIKSISYYLKTENIKVQTIYLGGGTPTILSENDLACLLKVINDYLISEATQEFTVEAGRPDTLTLDKFQLLKAGGVNRVCINPQTMQDKTLTLIGRKHTAKEVIDAINMGRIAGIENINMDIIVGLFNEGIKEYIDTAKSILAIKPENITVHTLALKRGSTMADNERDKMDIKVKQVEEGVKYFYDVLSKSGYMPYYLYRQKYMRGDMENIGYAIPNKFGLYNILMIEERQTIIGLGGGSASKFVNTNDWSLDSIYNPKEPKAYLTSMEKLVTRKVDKLIGLN